MFLDSVELWIENKKNCLGKTVLKMWFQIWGNWLDMSKKNYFKKKCDLKFLSFMCFYFFALFFKVTLWTNIAILPQIWDHIFKTVFPKLFFFSVQNSKLSRNMRKLRVKLRNATIYLPWGLIFKQSFFHKRTPLSSEMLDLLRRWHLNRIDEKNQGYF